MLETVRENIASLIALYEKEKERNRELALSLSRSEDELASCRKQITELKRQIANQELSGAFMGQEGNAVARNRLNKLIREIDNCIRLLQN